jgi:hypothetical protein
MRRLSPDFPGHVRACLPEPCRTGKPGVRRVVLNLTIQREGPGIPRPADFPGHASHIGFDCPGSRVANRMESGPNRPGDGRSHHPCFLAKAHPSLNLPGARTIYQTSDKSIFARPMGAQPLGFDRLSLVRPMSSDHYCGNCLARAPEGQFGKEQGHRKATSKTQRREDLEEALVRRYRELRMPPKGHPELALRSGKAAVVFAPLRFTGPGRRLRSPILCGSG